MAPPAPQDQSVLARKLRGPKMRLAGFPAMDPLCHTFASIAATRVRSELRPGINVSVYGYEVARHGDYLRGLFAPSALYLLSYAAQQGTGLAKAHPRLLGKVLDIYLGGDGSFEESNFSRALTQIDLSIYGRFVDLVTKCFDEAIRELCGRNQIGTAKRVRFEQQPGLVRIAADRSEIFIIKLNFHIGDDKRGAGLDFVVPVSTLEPLKRDLIAAQGTVDPTRAVWARHMLGKVTEIKLPMTATIDLGKYTVGELSRLEQGMLLDLPRDALGRVELRVQAGDGPVVVVRGKLGAMERQKAIRLNEDPDPRFLAPLRRQLDQRDP